jgi:membrane peptidoglycan carboxypeptidase
MLRAVVTEGTADRVEGMPPDARGKTGTTQGHKDVWFVGYTPDLVCAVWAGHPIYKSKNSPPAYGEEMAGGTWGATTCAPIWAQFMREALPIFKTAKFKELAREKAKLPPVAKPVTSADTAAAVEAAPSDSSSDSSSASPASDMPRETRRGRRSQPHDNGDGTVTVNVDDNSSLLAPDGAPDSHPETFTAGTQPTTLSPQYSAPQDSGDSGRIDPSGSSDSPPPSDPSSSSDTSHSRRHRRRDVGADTVTVTINPEDGLLATKWDPQTVTQTFPRGQEPHRYSRMYPPPPGER